MKPSNKDIDNLIAALNKVCVNEEIADEADMLLKSIYEERNKQHEVLDDGVLEVYPTISINTPK